MTGRIGRNHMKRFSTIRRRCACAGSHAWLPAHADRAIPIYICAMKKLTVVQLLRIAGMLAWLSLHLSIKDDGAGFDDVPAGNGIAGIRERVEQLAGTMSLASSRGTGLPDRHTCSQQRMRMTRLPHVGADNPPDETGWIRDNAAPPPSLAPRSGAQVNFSSSIQTSCKATADAFQSQ